MPRSIAEILPRPFDELAIADIAQLIGDLDHDQRESVVLEFKERPAVDKLAKSSAAFANTLGGLLIVGVTDAGELAGCERPVGEVQVWLKDVLRPRITPLPPFRARWLAMDSDERGLLLVLVERSSTTPHLLVNLGAIYVRNPGSSDPVPIHDARTLSELVARGDEARAAADARVAALLKRDDPASGDPFEEIAGGDIVVLAATGSAAMFTTELFTAAGTDRVRTTAVEALGKEFEMNVFETAQIKPPRWSQHAVWFERVERRSSSGWVSRLRVGAGGTVMARFAWVGEEPPSVISIDDLLERVRRSIRAGRQLLSELGAHGELLVGLLIHHPRDVDPGTWGGAGSGDLNVVVRREITFVDDVEADDAVVADIRAELARSVGIGPLPG